MSYFENLHEKRLSDSDSDKVYAAIVELSEPRRAIAAASYIVIEKFF